MSESNGKRYRSRHGMSATASSLALEMISAQDAAWFEANPGRRFRERPPVEGEFDIPCEDGTDAPGNRGAEYVLVEQIIPGVRVRRAGYHGDTREDVLGRTTQEMSAWIEKVRTMKRKP